jgi:hypothetical protein
MQERIAGWAIVGSALFTLFAIAHHPTAHGAAPAEILTRIRSISGHDRVVHGAIMVFLLALLFGFAVFSARLGLERTMPLIGLIAFAGAVLALAGAAVVDGFLVPDIAEKYAGADPTNIKVGIGLLAYGALVIQELTRLAVISSSVAVVCWSVSLLAPAHGVATRAVGALGIVSAAYTVIALSRTGYIGPHALLGIAFAQNLWYACAGMLLVRDGLHATCAQNKPGLGSR